MSGMFGKTRVVWNDRYEEYMCEKCNGIMYYDFSFKFCPFCRRKIVGKDERRARSGMQCMTGRRTGTII